MAQARGDNIVQAQESSVQNQMPHVLNRGSEMNLKRQLAETGTKDQELELCQKKEKRQKTTKENCQELRSINSLALGQRDVNIITKGEWLNDNHMRLSQQLLIPTIGGLQETLLSVKLQWKKMPPESVQIMHISNCHWICVSTMGCPPDTICVYDSMVVRHMVSRELKKQLAALVRPASHFLTVKIIEAQLQ